MCGIAGILATGDAVDLSVLQRMTDRLAHRGPDGEGFMIGRGPWDALGLSFHRRAEEAGADPSARIGLGHRRLAILDLSDRGLQPMRTADGRTWIVFNGEIYNHPELRSLLESRGHVFTTRTDTEVLLNAYVEWGDRCVPRLHGMFAFAVWDDRRGRLFCARDRLGIKPFYYAATGGVFVFASEIKAILAVPQCRREPDDEAVVRFLAHGNSDYGDRTLFRGVCALPAGHTLAVDPSGRTCIHQYWALDVDRNVSGGCVSDEALTDRLRQMLVDTVRSHLLSDVPVGSCLSGGLDSSTLVALIGRIRREDPQAASAVGSSLTTFTSCYEQRDIDEREYALVVSREAGATPHLVFPDPLDFWSDFARIAWHQDMPFAGLSYYAQWRVMRGASEAGIKVLIDGQGGDEVFGGYAKFRYAYLVSLLQARHVRTAAREVIAMLRHGDRYFLDIRNGYRYLPMAMRRMLRLDSVLQQVMRSDWEGAMIDESTPATRWWRNAQSRDNSSWTLMQRVQVDDLMVDTLPQLLRMEDRSSMAFSLEARVPLLDHRVVEFGLALPDRLKVCRGFSKFAVRQAMAGVLPDSVRLRTSKLGFAAPDRRWLADDLRSPITELLASNLRSSRYVDQAQLRHWYGSPAGRSANQASYLGLFRILSLEMWMRAFALSCKALEPPPRPASASLWRARTLAPGLHFQQQSEKIGGQKSPALRSFSMERPLLASFATPPMVWIRGRQVMVLFRRVSFCAAVLAWVISASPGGRAQSSLPVVPGGVGFGMSTRAAYGGGSAPTIYRITHLNDSGVGSLRAAVEASGPRVAIFETSGTIQLVSRLIVKNPYFTLAGQTAPSPGISLRGYTIEVTTNDVLIQHIRVRPGDEVNDSNGRSGLEVWGAGRNIVFDHVSAAWGNDEGIVTIASAASQHNITFRRVLVGEGLHLSRRAPDEWSKGALMYQGSQYVALIESAFVSDFERMPYPKGNTTTYVVNNIFYNWGDGRAAIFGDPDGAGPLKSTLMGNYFRRGPATPSSTSMAQSRYLRSGSQVYIGGNTRDGAGIEEFSVINNEGIDPRVSSPPISVQGHSPMSSSQAYDFVLANVGARPADRDSVDGRLVQDVRNRTGRIIKSQSEVGGWPQLAANVRPLTLPANPHATTSSGYTNLEVWLHGYSTAVEGGQQPTAGPAPPTGVRIVGS